MPLEENLPILFAIIISLVSFYSDRFVHVAKRLHIELVSLSAGISLTIVVLGLLPIIAAGSAAFGMLPYAAFLLGFLLFDISEKYIYQHILNRHEMMTELAELHTLGYFIDHFIIGFALILLYMLSSIRIIIFIFVLFLVHVIISSLSIKHIRERMQLGIGGELCLSFAPLAGAIVLILFRIPLIGIYGIFSFVTGALFFLTSRDVLKGKESLGYFIVGVAATAVAFVIATVL